MTHMLVHANAVLKEVELIEKLPIKDRVAEKLAAYDKMRRTLAQVTKCLDRLVASDFKLVQLRSVLRNRTNEYVALIREMEKAEGNMVSHSWTGPITRARIAVGDVLQQIDNELNKGK